MTSVPLFSADVSVFEDQDTGLRIECSEKYASALSEELVQAGFSCDPHSVALQGTDRIHDIVEFSVSGGTFVKLSQAVVTYFNNAGFTTTKESFHTVGEQHDRIHLTNASVFDK